MGKGGFSILFFHLGVRRQRPVVAEEGSGIFIR